MQEGTSHQSWVKCRKLEKTEMILWMLEDSDIGKDVIFPKGKNSIGTGKGKGSRKDGKDGAKSSGRVNTPKTQSQCWNWGKTGHQYKDCWVNLGRWPQQQSQRHSNSLGKGSDAKGKPVKSGGKNAKSKDAGTLVWNQQPSPVACTVASSTPLTETRTTDGTVDAIECTAMDLCATALTQHEIVNPRRIAFNIETGAGRTVWPMNAHYACEKISGPGGRNYKTATVEMVARRGRFCVRCQSAWRRLLQMTGEKTSVRKPLSSAGNVTDKGHALWLDGNVGYIIQKDSPILTAMRMCFRRVFEQHSWNGAIDLTKERGVYNLYVRVGGGDGNVGQTVECQSHWNEGRWVRTSCIGGPSAGESVLRRELSVPSGEEVIAPRVPPARTKPTQAEQDEHYDTSHAA